MSQQLIDLAKRKKWSKLEIALKTPKRLSAKTLSELLVRSCASGRVKLIEKCLDLGANVNCRWNTYTPLSTAAELIDPKPIRFLLDHGANIDGRGFDDATPLICVARFGLEWTDRDFRREALKSAKILLSAGASVDKVDTVNRTALDYAYAAKWPELAKLLFAQGAMIAACADKGEQVLFHAVTAVDNGKLLKTYLDHGGDPDLKIGFSKTAIDYARETGRDWAIKLLSKSKAHKKKTATVRTAPGKLRSPRTQRRQTNS